MPLFRVQDADRPMYVVEQTYSAAIALWMEVIAAENEIPLDEIEPPQGVEYVCCDYELVIKLPISVESNSKELLAFPRTDG